MSDMSADEKQIAPTDEKRVRKQPCLDVRVQGAKKKWQVKMTEQAVDNVGATNCSITGLSLQFAITPGSSSLSQS